jgi:hypothetical protein
VCTSEFCLFEAVRLGDELASASSFPAIVAFKVFGPWHNEQREGVRSAPIGSACVFCERTMANEPSSRPV